MAQSTLSIRIDENLKKDFDIMCNNFGMNISTAITIFAKKVVTERKIPFEITSNDDYGFYNEKNQIYLQKSIAELERGEYIVKTIEELEEITANE
ncbi:MAG: type II toxin-antitoxin system RelB/DinJ family antitoxin [Oscillospiraceae bacterium]|nr:type II toxin-antitoxin system RelB/DinJ family antitoxin [Oscillospiraceae bacterium]